MREGPSGPWGAVAAQAHEDCLTALALHLEARVRHSEARAAARLNWHLPLARRHFIACSFAAMADARVAAVLFADAAGRRDKARRAAREEAAGMIAGPP
jgi:hypothetical protein